MSRPSRRPFVPIGVFKTKKIAEAEAKSMNESKPGERWVACKGGDGTFGIVRKS